MICQSLAHQWPPMNMHAEVEYQGTRTASRPRPHCQATCWQPSVCLCPRSWWFRQSWLWPAGLDRQAWIYSRRLSRRDPEKTTQSQNTAERVSLLSASLSCLPERLHQRSLQYQVSEEVPLFGAHVVETDASIHEAANSLARRQREGLVLGQCWRRHCLAGGAGVLTFTGRPRNLSCGRKVKRSYCFAIASIESQVTLKVCSSFLFDTVELALCVYMVRFFFLARVQNCTTVNGGPVTNWISLWIDKVFLILKTNQVDQSMQLGRFLSWLYLSWPVGSWGHAEHGNRSFSAWNYPEEWSETHSRPSALRPGSLTNREVHYRFSDVANVSNVSIRWPENIGETWLTIVCSFKHKTS